MERKKQEIIIFILLKHYKYFLHNILQNSHLLRLLFYTCYQLLPIALTICSIELFFNRCALRIRIHLGSYSLTLIGDSRYTQTFLSPQHGLIQWLDLTVSKIFRFHTHRNSGSRSFRWAAFFTYPSWRKFLLASRCQQLLSPHHPTKVLKIHPIWDFL